MTTTTKAAPPEPIETAEATLKALGSNPTTGLAKADADARFAKQGPNEVPEKRSHPVLRLAKKFWGLSAWMIELIAVLSFFLHKRADVAIALGAPGRKRAARLLPGAARLGGRDGAAQAAAGHGARPARQDMAERAGSRARHWRRHARARRRLRRRGRAALRWRSARRPVGAHRRVERGRQEDR